MCMGLWHGMMHSRSLAYRKSASAACVSYCDAILLVAV